MLSRRPQNRAVILLIALISATGFGLFTNADMNFILKAYGLIFTCQIGFALFFLNQIRQQRSKVTGISTPTSQPSELQD
jgi:hypothetical protein